MTVPTEAPPTPPRIGRLTRLRHLQPVRFYSWPALVLLCVVVLVPAVAAGAWLALAVDVPALALVFAGIEAARRSVLSPVEVLRAMRDARV